MQGELRYAVVKTVNNDTIKHKMKRTASLRVCYIATYIHIAFCMGG